MLKKILHGFLDALAAFVLVVALLVSCLAHSTFNVKAAEKAVCTDKFYEKIKSDIVEGVESFGGIFDIPGEEVLKAVGEDNVKAYARQYTIDFFEAAYSGNEFEPEEFTDGELKEYIYNFVRAFEPEVAEEDLQEIYETVRKNVEGSVRYIPGLVKAITPIIGEAASSLSFIYNVEIYLYILFALAVAINLILSYEKRYLNTLYGLSGTLFCFLATVFIPLLMITIYDIPSRMVLEESVLLELIRGINKLVFVNTSVIFGIAFIIVTALLVTVSILSARKKYKENSEKTVDKIS